MERLVRNQKFRFNDKVYVKGFPGQFRVMRVYNDTVSLFGPFPMTENGNTPQENTCGIVSRELVTLHV